MPSAQDTTYLFKVMPETTQDFLTRDVDVLVSQIKENLRLTSLKAKSSVSQRNRSSPYFVRSRFEMRDGDYCHNRVNNNNNNNNNNKETEDDPVEKLRELLKQGRLINEAVKKLQTMNMSNSNSEIEDKDEDNDTVHHHQHHHNHHRGYRRKIYCYDSEDEPLPEVYQPLDL